MLNQTFDLDKENIRYYEDQQKVNIIWYLKGKVSENFECLRSNQKNNV